MAEEQKKFVFGSIKVRVEQISPKEAELSILLPSDEKYADGALAFLSRNIVLEHKCSIKAFPRRFELYKEMAVAIDELYKHGFIFQERSLTTSLKKDNLVLGEFYSYNPSFFKLQKASKKLKAWHKKYVVEQCQEHIDPFAKVLAQAEDSVRQQNKQKAFQYLAENPELSVEQACQLLEKAEKLNPEENIEKLLPKA